MPVSDCLILGDESGRIKQDRFFCVGILGTHKPREVYEQLRIIRERTNYFGEVSYKSSDERRALCSIRWIDWLFSGQDLVKVKILLKDSDNFNVSFFKNNKYDTDAAHLAYCHSYKEVLRNFADFAEDKKYFVYHQIELKNMKVDEYLANHISGLAKERCYSSPANKRKPHSNEFTLYSELIQLTDLITSTFRGLVCALYEDGINKSWVKKSLHQNLIYHLPRLKSDIQNKKNHYWRSYSPYNEQIFTVYNWKQK